MSDEYLGAWYDGITPVVTAGITVWYSNMFL